MRPVEEVPCSGFLRRNLDEATSRVRGLWRTDSRRLQTLSRQWFRGRLRVWKSAIVARRRERASQFTRALRLFRGSRRIFFEAGFALNIIVSLVKGLMP